MVVEVKPIAGPFTLGEGPHWDEKSKTLFFVDIDGKLLCKYNPANDTVTKCSLDAKPGFVLPIEGKKDQYLLGYGGDFALVSWDGQSGKPQEIKILTKGDPHPENRINDGKADPTGRVYAGSMCQVRRPDGSWENEKATFYSIENGAAKVRLEKVGLSNGLAWSLDQTKFYYIDSLLGNVRAFDYNLSNGDIGNGQVVFDLKENKVPGIPDGMTIDTKGKLWVAVFSGGRIIQVDPDSKKLLLTVDIPAHQTTSVAWGGDNLDELYVTSANFPDMIPADQKAKFTHNGFLFKVTGLGVKGLSATNAKI